MKRKKTSASPKKQIRSSTLDPKWQLEKESEASIVGSHFARAVTSVAYGQVDEPNAKATSPFRKIFYEEPLNNPSLSQAHVSAAFDAHTVEEQTHWQKRGNKFTIQERKFTKEPDQGPKRPEEFPYVFEKPITSFQRNRQVQPFNKIYKLSCESRRIHHGSSESPVTDFSRQYSSASPASQYHNLYHDPWKDATKPVCGMIPQSSAFKSSTPRFSNNIMGDDDSPTQQLSSSNRPQSSSVRAPDTGPSSPKFPFPQVGSHEFFTTNQLKIPSPQPKGLTNPVNRPKSAFPNINTNYRSTEELMDDCYKRTLFLGSSGTASTNDSIENLIPTTIPISRAHTANEATRQRHEHQHLNHYLDQQEFRGQRPSTTRDRGASRSPPRGASRSTTNRRKEESYQENESLRCESVPSLGSNQSVQIIRMDDEIDCSSPMANSNKLLRNASSSSRNFHENMVARWAPPMCYSKSKLSLQERIQNTSPDGGRQKQIAMNRLIDANYPLANIHQDRLFSGSAHFVNNQPFANSPMLTQSVIYNASPGNTLDYSSILSKDHF